MNNPEVLLVVWEIAIVVFFLLFPVLALIDLLKSQFSGNDKLIWTIVIIFVPIAGSLLYFFIAIKKEVKKR